MNRQCPWAWVAGALLITYQFEAKGADFGQQNKVFRIEVLMVFAAIRGAQDFF